MHSNAVCLDIGDFNRFNHQPLASRNFGRLEKTSRQRPPTSAFVFLQRPWSFRCGKYWGFTFCVFNGFKFISHIGSMGLAFLATFR